MADETKNEQPQDTPPEDTPETPAPETPETEKIDMATTREVEALDATADTTADSSETDADENTDADTEANIDEDAPTPSDVAAASQVVAEQAAPDDSETPVLDSPLPVAETPRAQTDLSHALHEGSHYSDTVTLPIIGRTVTVQGGVYTVVFAVLAIVTLLEVLIAEIFAPGALRIGALLALSVAKALLVIYFYMHLQSDNPLYRIILALPLVIVLVSLLFLVVAPFAGGYVTGVH